MHNLYSRQGRKIQKVNLKSQLLCASSSFKFSKATFTASITKAVKVQSLPLIAFSTSLTILLGNLMHLLVVGGTTGILNFFISSPHNIFMYINVITNSYTNYALHLQCIICIIYMGEKMKNYIKTKEEFAENLKYARQYLELSQQKIADRLKIERSTYAYYETGKTEMSVFHLLELENLFNVYINEIMTIIRATL